VHFYNFPIFDGVLLYLGGWGLDFRCKTSSGFVSQNSKNPLTRVGISPFFDGSFFFFFFSFPPLVSFPPPFYFSSATQTLNLTFSL
jgi:hypothetical protein